MIGTRIAPSSGIAVREPRISVIIATYQRRAFVVATVRALAGQQFRAGFEVIVVVDGSEDGTAEALRDLAVPFPLRIFEQPNEGLPAARSTGGFAARGEILLFMDDDMEAAPGLLAAHDASHREGAGIVIGPNPLHPESPPGLLSEWVDRWVGRRTSKHSAHGAGVSVSEIGGRFSVPREVFHLVGGFDRRLRRGGDVDFGYRVMQRGYHAVFNPDAVSWQRYVVTPREYLRQWHQSGQTDIVCARKHPDIAFRYIFGRSLIRRRFRALACLPSPLIALMRATATRLVEAGFRGSTTDRLFYGMQAVEYCRGLRKAGGLPGRRPLRVLMYTAGDNAPGSAPRDPSSVRPEEFRQQLESLLRAGYSFVSPHEAYHFVRSKGRLPRRPVLLTFDGWCDSTLESIAPVLKEFDLQALAFVGPRMIEEFTELDARPRQPAMPGRQLPALRRLVDSGVEFGVSAEAISERGELRAAVAPSDEIGDRVESREGALRLSRFVVYGNGHPNANGRSPTETVGHQVAFVAETGFVHPGADPLHLRRIEVRSGDMGWRLRWKVAVAGPLRSPGSGWASVAQAAWERWGATMLRRAYRSAVPVQVRQWAVGIVRR